MPHTMTLLFVMLVLATIAGHILTPGAFARVHTETGRAVLDPSSYHTVARNPPTFMDLMLAIPKGLEQNAPVIFMILCSLGGIQLVNESMAINAAIVRIAKKSAKADMAVIAGLSIMYGLIGVGASWTIGFAPFIPITVAAVRALGYDELLGAAIVILPGASGWTSGIINVYSTAPAQEFAGLPVFSGLWYRAVCFAVFLAVSLTFIISYAKKQRKSGKALPPGETETSLEVSAPQLTTRRKIVLIANVLGLAVLSYGTTALSWGMNHISGYWILIAIITGLAMKMKPGGIAEAFSRGMQSVVAAAFTIGLAAAFIVVLTDSSLMDPIIHGLSRTLSVTPAALLGVLIFITTLTATFFIAGIYGKTVTMMPLLAPLGDLLGVRKQVIVLAFIFGAGFTIWFWPTSPVGVASVGAAEIEYGRWMKFILKPMIALNIAAITLVVIAQAINLGPA